MLRNAMRTLVVVLVLTPGLMVRMAYCMADDAGTSAATTSESATEDLLAGPKVSEQSMDDGLGATRELAMRETVEIPFRRWTGVMRELDLTAAQRREVQRVLLPLQRQQREWARTHGKALRELMTAIREARENGTIDPKMIEQRDAFRASAPKTDEAQRAIWDLLTEDQQAQMQVHLKELREQMQQRVRGIVDGEATKKQDASDAMQNQRRGARDRTVSGDLDARAQRRLAFLRRHLSRQQRDAE